MGLRTWLGWSEANAHPHASVRAAESAPSRLPATVASVVAEREAGAHLADALLLGRGDRLTEALLAAGGRRSVAQLDPNFFRTQNPRGPSALPRPFAQHPGLYGITHKLARMAASAPWQIGKWDGKGGFRPDEGTEIGKRFERPNRILSESQFWYLTILYLYLFGEAFVLLDRDKVTEIPRNMGVIAGGRAWTPVLAEDRLPRAWVWRNNGEDIPFETHQLVYLRFPNPYNTLRGLAPAEIASLPIERDVLADRHEKSLLENGAMPGGVLQFPKDVSLSDDQYLTLKKTWMDQHGGPGKAGRFAILDNGGQFVYPEQTLADLQFVESRRYTLEQLCMVLGVDKWFVGLTDALPYANAREARQGLWEDALIPLLKDVTDAFNLQLLDFLPGKPAGRFNHADVPAMKAARRARIDDMLKLMSGRVSLKQASRQVDIDIEAEPGWDVPWVGIGQSPITEALLMAEAPPVAEPTGPVAEDTDDEDEAEETAETDEMEAMAQGHLAGMPAGRRSAAAARRQMWRKWQRVVLDKGERRFQTAARAWLQDIAAQITTNFEKVAKSGRGVGARESDFGPEAMKTLAEGNLFDVAVANQELVASFRPVAFDVAGLSSAFTSAELGPWTKIDLTHDAVQNFLNQRMALLSDARGGIAPRTRARLAKSLQVGLAKNESLDEMRTRIQEFAKALSDPARALTIARTESATIANSVRMIAGSEHAGGWIWQTADDEVVRPSHAQAEAETSRAPVPMGGTVMVGGAEMRHPGDPSGPAAETINCRCYPAFVPKEAV